MHRPAARAMLAGAFCLIVLTGMLVMHAWPLWTGQTLYLRVESASATDGLRTGLVTLDYAFDSVCLASDGCPEPDERRGGQPQGPALDLPARGGWADALAAAQGRERRLWNDQLVYLQVGTTPSGLEYPPTVSTPIAVDDRPDPAAVQLRGRLRQAFWYPRVALDLGLDAIYLKRGGAAAVEAATKAGTPIFAEIAVASNGQARVRALLVNGQRFE